MKFDAANDQSIIAFNILIIYSLILLNTYKGIIIRTRILSLLLILSIPKGK
jgi:hypothetical protein